MRYASMDRIRPSAEQQIRGDAGMVSETETGRDKSAVRRVVVVVGDPSLRNLIRNRLSRDARYRVEMTNSAATPHLPFTTRGADAVLLGLDRNPEPGAAQIETAGRPAAVLEGASVA